MSKFHSSPNGPGKCSAKDGNCPFGGESGSENHFDSMKDAEKAFEKSNEGKILQTISKSSNSKNIFKYSFTKQELKSITEKYPGSAILSPGKYLVLEEGEGAEYSTYNGEKPIRSSYFSSEEGSLTDQSTDEEILEYSKKNNKINYDTLRFIRDRMNRDTKNIETEIEGEYANGYSMSQHYYNVNDLKREYPGLVDSKNQVSLPHAVTFEIKNTTPVINTTGVGIPEKLIEESVSKEDENNSWDIRYRLYLGDPDSNKGGWLENRN